MRGFGGDEYCYPGDPCYYDSVGEQVLDHVKRNWQTYLAAGGGLILLQKTYSGGKRAITSSRKVLGKAKGNVENQNFKLLLAMLAAGLIAGYVSRGSNG